MLAEDKLRHFLVHGQRGRQDAGSGVRETKDFEKPLQRAIFSVAAMQCNKDDFYSLLGKDRCNPMILINKNNIISAVAEGLVHRPAAPKRNLALRRSPPGQNTYSLIGNHKASPEKYISIPEEDKSSEINGLPIPQPS